MTNLDSQAHQILHNLCQHFKQDMPTIQTWQSDITIGIEIEIKWSAYFPQLWEKYLKTSSFKNLSFNDKEALSKECTGLETVLLPKLQATQACGLEKGQDKYYEFAFPPIHNVYLINAMIQSLRAENLIPLGEHSLHLTVGNLPVCKDTYYLLLLLETQACNAQRIASAFHLENASLSATWARKGMGGLFQKEARELKNDASCASEFRTLHLTENTNVIQILKDTSIISQAIIDKRQGIETKEVLAWNRWLEKAKEVLNFYSLADENWKKPNLTPQYWRAYMLHLENIKEMLLPATVLLHQSYHPVLQKIKIK